MSNNKTAGFGTVGIVIVTLAVLIITGVVGWRVWNTYQANPAISQKNTPTTDSYTIRTGSDTLVATASYLNIKELGIKIKLNDDIKDAVYYYDSSATSNPKIRVSTQSLIAISNGTCDPSVSDPFGYIVKTSQKYQPNGSVLSPNGVNVFQFGDYYVFYSTPMSACSSDKIASDLQTAQLQSFKEAVKTIQSNE